MGILSARDRTPLRGRPCRQALHSMTLPDNRSPLTSDRLEPSSTTCPFQIGCCGETAINRNTHGVIRLYLSCKLIPAASHHSAKNVVASPSPLTHNFPTKQRVPHFRIQAGAEMTFRTTRIKHQILPRFCFNDPSAGGRSKHIIPPETAVIRGRLSRNPIFSI